MPDGGVALVRVFGPHGLVLTEGTGGAAGPGFTVTVTDEQVDQQPAVDLALK
jgi:hypothetical protein